MRRLPILDGPILDWLRDFRSADAIFVSDGRQRVVAWSPEAGRLLGRSAAEVLGRPCYEVMSGTELNGHPVCRRNCRVAANARRGRPTVAYDIVARTADGEPICLTSSIIL
ncbi:MAG: PAS domain-containing protein, partial [Candidatus Limnocylindrales bacterium]|nr:PAS domain-containing protein [Candidatus Limnocylindrales bacterium]